MLKIKLTPVIAGEHNERPVIVSECSKPGNLIVPLVIVNECNEWSVIAIRPDVEAIPIEYCFSSFEIASSLCSSQ